MLPGGNAKSSPVLLTTLDSFSLVGSISLTLSVALINDEALYPTPSSSTLPVRIPVSVVEPAAASDVNTKFAFSKKITSPTT